MKSTYWFRIILVLSVFIAASCGDDPKPTVEKTPEELALEKLTGTGTKTWALAGGSVTRDGVNITDTYTGFELVLNSGTSKTYSTKNNNSLFDANGNWSFAGVNFDKFTLTGSQPASSREISFTESSDKLTLVFSIPLPGGRIESTQAVAGSYVFILLKK